ncbi:unnamed protein product [Gordionus sp. m RMFG-2023]
MTVDNEENYEEINNFIMYHKYPTRLAKNNGEKRNLRVKASRFTMRKEKLYHHKNNGELLVANMKNDVVTFINSCDTCQRCNTRFDKTTNELQSIPVRAKVWSQIGVDLCTFPESEDGYKYIAVAVDYFSKYVVAMPLKDKTAKSIQINDQGREFVNEVSTNYHKLVGTMQRVTSAYHPQANGMVERVNRTIQNELLKCIKDDQLTWTDALPGILFAYNTSDHESSKFTPFELMYGRKTIQACGDDEDYDIDPDNVEEIDKEKHFQSVVCKMQDIHNIAIDDEENFQEPSIKNVKLNSEENHMKVAPPHNLKIVDCEVGMQNKKDGEIILDTVISKKEETNLFLPTNRNWKIYHSERFHFAIKKRYPKYDKGVIGNDHSTERIIGDGNCLFRCISKDVCDDECHYNFLRQQCCLFMRSKDIVEQIEWFLGEPVIFGENGHGPKCNLWNRGGDICQNIT